MIYISNLAKGSITNSKAIAIGASDIPPEYYQVSGSGDDTLEIDLLRACRDMCLQQKHGVEEIITVSIRLD